ncbi:MAG: 30S ribosomal protein S17 [Candidatus Taylorbacteria bacterium]|nr:30S ribosomal protein S17 [Candidatus Taylorbacteria bacterium]
MEKTSPKTNETKARRQTFVGKVVSTKMKDTTVVIVERYVKHQKYGKFMKKQTKIMAHDPGNTKKEGEQATVEACAPISKRKAFKVIA